MGDVEDELGEILIVDDNPGDIRLIEEAFRVSSLDPTIHTSTTKDDALAFLSHTKRSEDSPGPALVLLDWNLSQTTGEDVLDAAKSMENPIAVIVMSGSDPETPMSDSAIDRADLVMEKPREPEEYVESVRSVITNQ